MMQAVKGVAGYLVSELCEFVTRRLCLSNVSSVEVEIRTKGSASINN